MTKKFINKLLTNISIYEFVGALNDLKDTVNNYINRFGGDATVLVTYNDDTVVYELMSSREETDLEYEIRQHDEKLKADAFEQNEKKFLQQLKKKYPNI
jgi:hypothetical protein